VEALEDRTVPSVTFSPPVNYDVGKNPWQVVSADLTGNGIQDLVVAQQNGVAGYRGIDILMGNGNGTFQPAVNISTPGFVDSVAVADVNGDGIPDIVTGNWSGGTVSVLLGNGNGTFQAPVNYTIAASAVVTSIAVADVNGDGKPDIIACNSNGSNSTVNVLLGNGNGTFQAPVSYASGGYGGDGAPGMVVADVNGDGKPDIVMANSSSNTASVLFNQGNGTFGSPTNLAAGSGGFSVAVADLNGDGIPDIVSENSTGNSVNVMLGTGNGTFAAPQSYSTGAGTDPLSIALADMNGDGKPDIITADNGTNQVSVLLNNGNGTFAVPQTFAAGTNPRALAVADFNGDGKPDIVTGNNFLTSLNGHQNVSVLLANTTSPYFMVTGSSSVTAGTAGNFTISVLNPDGTPDTSYSGTVQITSSDPQAVLPANFAISGGTATFSATLKTAGLQSLTATDTVTSSITGSDAVIQVNPAAASQFVLSAPASVKSGTAFSPTLTVKDVYGNVVTGYTGTVHFTSSDSTATLPANYTFTAADAGVHSFTNQATLKKKGKQTLTATDTQNSSLTATATITVNG
jgi:hypothetical protein